MIIRHSLPIMLSLVILGCGTFNQQGTISELNDVQPELKDTRIEDGLDKAMASYQHYLQKTPESQMTPEAMRRLADLKIEKEFGTLGTGSSSTNKAASPAAANTVVAPFSPKKYTRSPAPIGEAHTLWEVRSSKSTRPVAASRQFTTPAVPTK